MFPSASFYDHLDVAFGYVEELCKLPHGHLVRDVQGSNFTDLLVGQAGAWVSRSYKSGDYKGRVLKSGTAFTGGIMVVISYGTEKQMIWTDTVTNVARMTDAQIIRDNVIVGQSPGKSVNKEVPFSHSGVFVVERSIPTWGAVAGPKPARVRTSLTVNTSLEAKQGRFTKENFQVEGSKGWHLT